MEGNQRRVRLLLLILLLPFILYSQINIVLYRNNTIALSPSSLSSSWLLLLLLASAFRFDPTVSLYDSSVQQRKTRICYKQPNKIIVGTKTTELLPLSYQFVPLLMSKPFHNEEGISSMVNETETAVSDDSNDSTTSTTTNLVTENQDLGMHENPSTKYHSSTLSINATAAIEFANLVGRLKVTPRTGWLRRNIVPCESVADHSWRVAILAFLLLPPTPSSSSSSSMSTNNNNVDNTDQRGNDAITANVSGDINTVTNIDIGKIMQLALIHDLAECIVGDITPEDNVSNHDKRQMEETAMNQITTLLQQATAKTTFNRNADGEDDTMKLSSQQNNNTLLMQLFHEYEDRTSMESKIVKDLDLLDMILQADTYEKQQQQRDHNNNDFLSDFFIGTPPSRFQVPSIRQIAAQLHQQRNDRLAQSARNKRRDTNSNNNNNINASNSIIKTTETQERKEEGEGNSGSAFTTDIAATVTAIKNNGQSDTPTTSCTVITCNNESLLSESDLQFVTEYSLLTTTTTTTTGIQPATSRAVGSVADIVAALREWDIRQPPPPPTETAN